MIEISLTEESSFVSVMVTISNEVMKSSASNHLEVRPLQFQVHSQAFLEYGDEASFFLLEPSCLFTAVVESGADFDAALVTI